MASHIGGDTQVLTSCHIQINQEVELHLTCFLKFGLLLRYHRADQVVFCSHPAVATRTGSGLPDRGRGRVRE